MPILERQVGELPSRGLLADTLVAAGRIEHGRALAMELLGLKPVASPALEALVRTNLEIGDLTKATATLIEQVPTWSRGSLLSVHIARHLVEIHSLNGLNEAALAAYDRYLHPTEGGVQESDLREAALALWQLWISDTPLENRAIQLVAAFENIPIEPRAIGFELARVTTTILARDHGRARSLLRSYEAHLATNPPANIQALERCLLPLARGLLAYGEGRFVDADSHFTRGYPHIFRLGGSAIEWNQLEWTILQAAKRANNQPKALMLLSKLATLQYRNAELKARAIEEFSQWTATNQQG
jgi:hypothetical protein